MISLSRSIPCYSFPNPLQHLFFPFPYLISFSLPLPFLPRPFQISFPFFVFFPFLFNSLLSFDPFPFPSDILFLAQFTPVLFVFQYPYLSPVFFPITCLHCSLPSLPYPTLLHYSPSFPLLYPFSVFLPLPISFSLPLPFLHSPFQI